MKLLHHCGAILTLLVTLIALYCAPAICRAEEGHWTQPCDVVWTSPSHDAAGSMPLGNGEVGINLWVEPGGDLVFYISRSDSLSEVSRLLKVGGVRVSFSPNPFTKNAAFQQHLRLRDGVCEITEGDGDPKLTLRVFVDADQPVVHVTGESASPLTVKAVAESQAHASVSGPPPPARKSRGRRGLCIMRPSTSSNRPTFFPMASATP